MYKLVAFQGDPKDADDLVGWVSDELSNVEQSFFDLDMVQLVEQHVAPAKPRDGMTLLADGSDWDPGSGQGIYTYYNGAWRKLG